MNCLTLRISPTRAKVYIASQPDRGFCYPLTELLNSVQHTKDHDLTALMRRIILVIAIVMT